MVLNIDYKKLLSGLWRNNPALVQILGLCPLLGVSNTTVNSLGLGVATILVLVASSGVIALMRGYVPVSIRLPVFVMLIAACTGSVELLMQAYVYDLYQSIGLFIPLIVTNCLILARAESFASKNSVILAICDGFIMGLGFLVALLLLGMVRELLGQGTLFADMDLLFGVVAKKWQWEISGSYKPILFVALPPGAFIVMGFFISVKNYCDLKKEKRERMLNNNYISDNIRLVGFKKI